MKKLLFSFLPIPEEIMGSKDLSWGAKYLFGIIAKVNQEDVRLSIRYLAKRMGCQDREARKRVKELTDYGLIESKSRQGRVNGYVINIGLIIGKQTPVQMDTPVRNEPPTPVRNEPPNSIDVSNKEVIAAIAADTPFSFHKYLASMKISKQRHIQIIALYWEHADREYENAKQCQAAINRSLRPARDLAGY